MKVMSFQIIEQELFPEENRLAVYKESYPLGVVEKEGRIFLAIASPIYDLSSRVKSAVVPKEATTVQVLRNGMNFINTPKNPSKYVGAVNVTRVEKKQLLHPAREQWVDVPVTTTYHVFWNA
jgi:hypothetical protein